MRRPPQIKVPDRAHPLIRFMFEEMRRHQCGVMALGERSGINPNTLRAWRTKSEPRLSDLDACLNVLGWQLSVKPVKEKDDGE